MTYTTTTEKIENRPGTWNSLAVSIFADGVLRGAYIRNYSTLYKTFYPFTKNGKDYALYSRDYTATRVMALPLCEDLGGEDGAAGGFCPVEYYVPEESNGRYGFVAGCVWGDDTSWKIQFLDLSDIEHGIVKRDDRFGYIELPANLSLEQAFSVMSWDDDGDTIDIAVMKRFRLGPDGSFLSEEA